MAQLSVRAKAGGRAANTYKMAEVVALWWNNDRVAAINRLEEYARQMPDDLSFQLALTRPHSGRHPKRCDRSEAGQCTRRLVLGLAELGE